MNEREKIVEQGNEIVSVSDTISTITYALKTELTYEGITYKEIKMNFDNLTGQDILDITKDITASGEMIITEELSPAFLTRLAARAAGLHFSIIAALSIKDFMNIKNIARKHMIDAGL